MKKRVFKILKIAGIVVIALLIVSMIGISWYTGDQVAEGLVNQNQQKDTRMASEYQLKEWNYNQQAFEDKYSTTLISAEGKDGYVIPIASLGNAINDGDSVVILIHGLGGDYVSIYPQAEMFLDNGWKVVAIDQRASGYSTDEYVTFGYNEKNDVRAAVDYVRNINPSGSLVIQGFSMGGATVGLYAGSKHANENVDAIILDSAFVSMESMFRGYWEDMDTGIPTDYTIFCGDIALKLKYGFNFDDVVVTESLLTCKIPTLIIQSTNDEICPVVMGEELFDAIDTSQKELWIVDSTHIDAFIDFPIEYKEKVFEFLTKESI